MGFELDLDLEGTEWIKLLRCFSENIQTFPVRNTELFQ